MVSMGLPGEPSGVRINSQFYSFRSIVQDMLLRRFRDESQNAIPLFKWLRVSKEIHMLD